MPLTREIPLHQREVLNVRQAGEYMGISEDVARNYAVAGTLPAFRLGNRWKFRRRLLDEWMTRESQAGLVSQQKPATSEALGKAAGSGGKRNG